MKKIIALLFVISMCSNAQDYFPLKVGNSWTYCSSQDTTYKRTYLIKDTVNIEGKKCFLYGRQNDIESDTLWKDINGNVWKRENSTFTLWFDFINDSGSVYYYRVNNNDSFTVTTRKYLSINTYVKTFDKCIQLFFNIPSLIDDEVEYTFTPEVGLIQKMGAWSNDLLYSAYINGTTVRITDDLRNILTGFALSQNYPNPFNPETVISYQLAENSKVSLKVYDVLGNEVAVLINEEKPAGKYQINFNTHRTTNNQQLSSGVYFYRLQAGNFVQTKKFILMK